MNDLREINRPPLPKSWGQVNYSDGSASREIEEQEDWETTGQQETNKLYAKCKQKRSILEVIDRLNNLRDLVTLCHDALTNSELLEIKSHVSHVLYFQVIEQLKIAEQELADL